MPTDKNATRKGRVFVDYHKYWVYNLLMKILELQKHINSLRQLLLSELSVLKTVTQHTFDGRAGETKILLASACTTGTAIFELSKKPEYFYTETMMLSRSLIEKLTNFCYLQVCEDKEFRNFKIHPYYRTYHNFEKIKYAGQKSIKLKFDGKDSYKNNHLISEALKSFSESNPTLNWSSKNIDLKISVIEKKTNIAVEFFLMNTLTIYSNASEALHGSLYGCTFHLGLYEPNIDHKDATKVEINLLKNLALLYAQLGSIIHEVIKYLASTNNIQESLLNSEKNSKQVLMLIKTIFEN